MKRGLLILIFISLWEPSFVFTQSIVNTPHNLSVSGKGEFRAQTESDICKFCHTPHIDNPSVPMWNREDPGVVYDLYNSSTLEALPGQPDGTSIMCLSCHDGTIALGNIKSQAADIDFTSTTKRTKGKSNLSTDLRDDHPVSFVYDSRLADSDGELIQPSTISPPVFITDNKVQCTTCHDPHKNVYSDFLVSSNQYSALCNSCHEKENWTTSSHQSSNAKWNGTLPNPWPNSDYTTVSENACASCHWSHNSGGIPFLLKYQAEESNCLDCHNGNVAETDIQIQLTKTYTHNVYGYTGTHDPSEPSIVLDKHVECIDCHNPHASNNFKATAPNVNGYLFGVKGIDQNGIPIDPVQFEYEICYRCHSDNPATQPAQPRVEIQNNVRLEFDLSNPSFHPVAGPGVNSNVPSLINPLNENSMIYCSSCHASDGQSSPAGPHGSIYPQILKYNYATNDNTNESPMAYELCYSCHSRRSILNNESFPEHDSHIRELNTPCIACHDAHGISNTQGNSINNTNLINFNLKFVTPFKGIIQFEDEGLFKGNCTLTCHGKGHGALGY
jgi:predicted CXXCH cytochrome family protein